MINRIEKIIILLVSSVVALYYLYSLFVALVAPESRARDLWPGALFAELILLGFITALRRGLLGNRTLTWAILLLLAILVVAEPYVSGQLFRA